MVDGPNKARLTAAMLREEGWRLLKEARATPELRERSQLARQALDLAQVAELMDATDQRGGTGTVIPTPRRWRRPRVVVTEKVAPEQEGSS